jgi:hypothetical protein
MNMGMVMQIPRPGLQDRQHPQFGSEVFMRAAHIAQGPGAFAQQEVGEDAFE